MHTLRYRYTLDELPVMLDKVRLRSETYDNWCKEVSKCLNPDEEKTLSLTELKGLLTVAQDGGFANSELFKVRLYLPHNSNKLSETIF